jgi:hypothetical protein
MRSMLGVGNMTSENWILIIQRMLSGMGSFPSHEMTSEEESKQKRNHSRYPTAYFRSSHE